MTKWIEHDDYWDKYDCVVEQGDDDDDVDNDDGDDNSDIEDDDNDDHHDNDTRMLTSSTNVTDYANGAKGTRSSHVSSSHNITRTIAMVPAKAMDTDSDSYSDCDSTRSCCFCCC